MNHFREPFQVRFRCDSVDPFYHEKDEALWNCIDAGVRPGDNFLAISSQAKVLGNPESMIKPSLTSLLAATIFGGMLLDVSADQIYVAQEVTPSGAVSTFATGFNGAWGLAFHDGNLFVANNTGNSISEVSPSGGVSTFAIGLSSPTGIAFDSWGNLFVCSGAGSLDSIAPDGALITVATGLDNPTAIVIVPEPTALGLVALGGVAMLVRRKRVS